MSAHRVPVLYQQCTLLDNVSAPHKVSSIDAPQVFITHLHQSNWEPIRHHLIQEDHIIRVKQTDVFDTFRDWCEEHQIIPHTDYRTRLVKHWGTYAAPGEWLYITSRMVQP
jgi:hypothetical protein